MGDNRKEKGPIVSLWFLLSCYMILLPYEFAYFTEVQLYCNSLTIYNVLLVIVYLRIQRYLLNVSKAFPILFTNFNDHIVQDPGNESPIQYQHPNIYCSKHFHHVVTQNPCA